MQKNHPFSKKNLNNFKTSKSLNPLNLIFYFNAKCVSSCVLTNFLNSESEQFMKNEKML